MKIPKQLSALLLLIAFFFIFHGCSRKDFSESGIMKDGSVNVSWLKSNFEKSNANGLLKVTYGADLSYNQTPQWDKASSARNAAGKNYYFVPLINDEFVTMNGQKRKLSVVNQKSYLVAYSAANNSETLTFLKGDYQLTDNLLPGSAPINGSTTEKIFSGIVNYTDINKRVASYSYSSKPRKTSNKRTLSRAATDSIVIDAVWLEMFLYKKKADTLMAEWNMPITVDSLIQLKGSDEEYLMPGQYVFNINTLQKVELQSYLRLFGIIVEYGLDILPVGESTMVCTRICRWGAECPGTGEVFVAVTTIADDRLNCEAPTWNGACGSNWTLVESETGSCGWTEGTGGAYPGGGTPLPGDGGIGGGGDGGGGGTTTPAVRVNDKLCPQTFKSFTKGNDKSFFKTNAKGLKFETTATQVNNVPSTLIHLTNGISDIAMNTVPTNDYLNLHKTSMGYLKEIFPQLIAHGDVYYQIEGGQKYWYFSDYAAAVITTWSLDFAGREVALFDRFASNPGNQRAWGALWNQANTYIRTFMPGSNIRQGEDPNATTSNAIYDPKCQF
ncbi:hypothetical protein LQ567_22850 [Niabella pedocola]|uniref:Uncharacterized protein n=1 Tax=Niabella pedocola TaxID=1752077 RepID=A0ABS8PX46_9BACT|nr:hypothetical protein [Niabella pedocola]MCD2425641.1 hypothetical protein [Niabella pedocola]